MNATAQSTAPQTTARAGARYRNTLFETAADRHSTFLDAAVPLKAGSHKDVVRYLVEIPMRFAECFALLKDGRKVPLANKRTFVAWSGRNSRRSLMFEAHGLRIETVIDPSDVEASTAPGNVASIDIQPASAGAAASRSQGHRQTFIAIDGAIYA